MATEPTIEELKEILKRIEEEQKNLYPVYNYYNLTAEAFQRVTGVLKDLATNVHLDDNQNKQIIDFISDAMRAFERRHLSPAEYSAQASDSMIAALEVAYAAIESQIVSLNPEEQPE